MRGYEGGALGGKRDLYARENARGMRRRRRRGGGYKKSTREW